MARTSANVVLLRAAWRAVAAPPARARVSKAGGKGFDGTTSLQAETPRGISAGE